VELQAVAERLPRDFREPDFKASTDWLFQFRNRPGIANRKMCGESPSADDVSVEAFREKRRRILEMADCHCLKFTMQTRRACFGRLFQRIVKPTKRELSTY
jgi:hypothetical protein